MWAVLDSANEASSFKANAQELGRLLTNPYPIDGSQVVVQD
jgi:hypothetical protein